MFTRRWQRVAADAAHRAAARLAFDGFAVALRATRRRPRRATELHARTQAYPASAGFRPVRRRLRRGAPLALDFAAQRVVLDSDGLPTGAFAPPDTVTGDDCFVGLHRDPCLHWPGVLRLRLSSNHAHWVVYERPARALCVEPWTAPPDALNGAPALVRPGEPLLLEMRLRWERSPGQRKPAHLSDDELPATGGLAVQDDLDLVVPRRPAVGLAHVKLGGGRTAGRNRDQFLLHHGDLPVLVIGPLDRKPCRAGTGGVDGYVDRVCGREGLGCGRHPGIGTDGIAEVSAATQLRPAPL
jgi:hypothetical protein